MGSPHPCILVISSTWWSESAGGVTVRRLFRDHDLGQFSLSTPVPTPVTESEGVLDILVKRDPQSWSATQYASYHDSWITVKHQVLKSRQPLF
jgi:hypothetical protein